MVSLTFFIEFVIHIDKYLGLIIQTFGIFSYVILFIIVFCETGLVLTPFLPGDSLLFVSGAFAARGEFNIFILYIMFLAAAIFGDSVNYWIGHYLGEKVFEKSRFFKKEYLHRAKEFYKKHGGKTIVFARFIPIMRTFAPFVAGIGKMHYQKFLVYNIAGGTIWVSLLLLSGFFFGRIPFIENNLNWIIYIIIIVSLIPIFIEYIRSKIKKNKR